MSTDSVMPKHPANLYTQLLLEWIADKALNGSTPFSSAEALAPHSLIARPYPPHDPLMASHQLGDDQEHHCGVCSLSGRNSRDADFHAGGTRHIHGHGRDSGPAPFVLRTTRRKPMPPRYRIVLTCLLILSSAVPCFAWGITWDWPWSTPSSSSPVSPSLILSIAALITSIGYAAGKIRRK